MTLGWRTEMQLMTGWQLRQQRQSTVTMWASSAPPSRQTRNVWRSSSSSRCGAHPTGPSVTSSGARCSGRPSYVRISPAWCPAGPSPSSSADMPMEIRYPIGPTYWKLWSMHAKGGGGGYMICESLVKISHISCKFFKVSKKIRL